MEADGMTRNNRLGLVILIIVLLFGQLTVTAQELHSDACVDPICEPRLKFLDDLWCLGRTSSYRNPYGWTYVWERVDEGDDVESAEDVRWGFKLRATDQDGWVPESALELRFTAPTGGRAFSTQQVEYGLDYIYGWEIVEGWELFGSTGFGTQAWGDFGLVPEEPASDRFIAWTQSLALGAEITERITVYQEFFGIFSHGLEDDYAEVYFNIGVDFYLTHNLVLDVRSGVGLTPDADDLFGGVGGGYRF
jgi:hypothetical protein